MKQQALVFPKEFVWGTATAGHQIEGHNIHSDWWKFEQEGKIYDGTKSGRCMDYWNRYEEDHELMEKLGYKAFRLGIEWAKIEPEEGRFDMKAIEHYRKILKSVRKHGMKICLTLYHWVLPLWFAQKGGWESDSAFEKFDRFVKFAVDEFGEFPDIWVTINEPSSPSTAGYLMGIFPPEKKSFIAYCAVIKKFLLAHAMAYKTIHDKVQLAPDGGPVMVGIAQAYQHVEAFGSPGLFGVFEGMMSQILSYGSFRGWDRSIVTGRIQMPYGLNEFVSILKDSYDYCGVNYYTRMSMKFDQNKPDQVFVEPYAIPEGMKINQMGWQNYPPGFHKVLSYVWETFHKPIYITENGCADAVDDQRREYTLEHLAQIHRAIGDGIDVRGYYHWSYMDNFEWREGFVKKLGLVACDHTDPELKRIPRKSAYMYSDIIKKNAITAAIVKKYSPETYDGVFGDKWMI
jgi:beta-glucosidase